MGAAARSHVLHSATLTPAGPVDDPAGQHGVVLADVLAGDSQAEPVEQAERVKISGAETRLRPRPPTP